jgi:hypothetical protein
VVRGLRRVSGRNGAITQGERGLERKRRSALGVKTRARTARVRSPALVADLRAGRGILAEHCRFRASRDKCVDHKVPAAAI